MSFHYVPGQFRIPKTPLFAMPDGIWCGADADSGVFAFEAGYSWGGRIMSRELCFSLSIDGSVMKPVFSSINGYIYWSGSGYVYYTQTYGWVYMSGMFPGYEPLEDYDSKDGERTWTGDRFYTFYSFPQQNGSAATLTPRGAIHDSGQEKELTVVWPRWKAKRNTSAQRRKPRRKTAFPRLRFTGTITARKPPCRSYPWDWPVQGWS
jgi:hypothetical protein